MKKYVFTSWSNEFMDKEPLSKSNVIMSLKNTGSNYKEVKSRSFTDDLRNVKNLCKYPKHKDKTAGFYNA